MKRGEEQIVLEVPFDKKKEKIKINPNRPEVSPQPTTYVWSFLPASLPEVGGAWERDWSCPVLKVASVRKKSEGGILNDLLELA